MKSIHLHNILPHPLRDNVLNKDSVWDKECSIQAGDRCLVCAPSGTGKSTLLSCIYGLRNDYSGNLCFDEEDVKSFSLSRWADIRCRKLSMVFQDMLLFPQLTAMENIGIKQKLQTVYTEEQIKAMAIRLGMGEKLEKKCGILSLGQQQRVAIIRALCQPFSFLLLDEPFSHLDEANSRAAAALIEEACKTNEAALMITSLSDNNYFTYNRNISV